MRRIAFLGALLSLLALVPAPARGGESASGPSAPPVPVWTVCKAEGISVRTNRGSKQTFYLSGAVSSPDDQGFAKAFARFIEDKYLGKSMRELPACWSAASQAEAQDSIEKKVGSSRWNIAYVATGWTKPPAIPATDAAPQEQPAKSQ